MRGISFTHQHLIDFAIRRFSFVARWSLVVMLLSSLLIHAPLILKNFPLFQSIVSPDDALVDQRWRVARAVLTGVLLLFATMQITLTFHSESLSKAMVDHRQFVVRNWWPLARFSSWRESISICSRWPSRSVQLGLGDGTALGIT